MFQQVQAAPPDAILGLTEAFKKDPNPEKMTLGVGVFKDADGNTPILSSVKAAEERILEMETSKSYMPIQGDSQYGELSRQLVFGEDREAVADGRIVSAHTPGGTGALRVAADFIAAHLKGSSVWVSDPTWANHKAIFTAAGVEVKTYRYYDPSTKGLNLAGMLEDIAAIPAGDVILLHGCCHNPTGVDPEPGEWGQILNAVRDAKLLPMIDFAYQGFGDGVEEDALVVRIFADEVEELIVCNSYSKNFGLYNERTGAVHFMAADADQAQAVLSQVKKVIRCNYSNPPAHGARVVSTILGDEELQSQWLQELADMRGRIADLRVGLKSQLIEQQVPGDWEFVTKQKGMFSYTGLTPEQVARLKDEYSIYIVGSGRINIAGLNDANIDRLVVALKKVLG